MSDQSANEHGSPVTFRFSNIGPVKDAALNLGAGWRLDRWPKSRRCHQRPHRMLRETRVAAVRETGGRPVEEAERPVDLPQQQRSGVGRDRSAVERGREHMQ